MQILKIKLSPTNLREKRGHEAGTLVVVAWCIFHLGNH